MSLVLDIKNRYGLMVSVQDISKELRIPKKAVEELIDTGVLQAVETMGKKYVSAFNLAKMLGESAVDSGQLASGYPIENALYLSHNTESEDSSMNKIYTGGVYPLKDGEYIAQVNMGKTADGKRLRPGKRFKAKEEAEHYLAQRLAELNGIPIQQQPIFVSADTAQSATYTEKTFEQYSRDILNRGIGKAKARTIEGYRSSLVPVLKYIGNMRMTDIEDRHLIKMYSELSLAYSQSSLKKAFVTVKMLFEEAFAKDEVPSNPFIRLECPDSQKPSKAERLPYSDEEIKRILSAAKSYHNPILYTIFAVLECTGMRPGELRGLEWVDFDSKAKTIKVRQAVVTRYESIEDMKKRPRSYEAMGMTKSIYGIRTLPLSDMAASALLEWRKYLDTMPSAMKNSKYIFPSKEGNFKSESSIKCLVQRFVKSAGLKDIGVMLYRFRHTMCTRLILDGQPISVIQLLMGDNTQDVIMKVYTHVTQQQALAATSGYYDKLNESHKALYGLM